MKWAIVEGDYVSNIVVWDGTGEIFSGITIVQINEGESCNIGDSYDLNGNPRFISQPEP
jgi:hypothetical protein